jgi:molybdate/tungstate transport system substrate-binding protein
MPLMEMEAAFEALYPEYDIRREAAGSRTCARKISDLNRTCDVFLSADVEIIQTMLIPEHASWSLPFATNELCLVYREGHGFSRDQSPVDWMTVLSKNTLEVGRSDPDSDPCGYRTIQVLRLADLEGQTAVSQGIIDASEHNVRPKSADLIAMLETGALDVAFMYRSVALQHGLNFIPFPDRINLGNPAMWDNYTKATVDVAGATPDTSIRLTALPIVYGVTIPSATTQGEGAEKFVAFLLSEEGSMILEENHQEVLKPRWVLDNVIIPPLLKPYVQE